MNSTASRTPAESARFKAIKARLKLELAEAERESSARRPTLGELRAQIAERKQRRAALGISDDETHRRPRMPTLLELRAKFMRTPTDGAGRSRPPEDGEVPAANGAADSLVSVLARRPDPKEIGRQYRQTNAGEVRPIEAPNPYKRTRLQEATAEWLGEVEWNLMVTFTFKGEDGVSLPLATKIFGKFIPRLREIVLRKGSTRRIPMAVVVENSREQLQHVGLEVDGREGTHIHVLLRVRGDDPYKYKGAIGKAWKLTNRRCGDPTVYCPDSNEWYLPLTSDEMRKGYTGYILKHHGTDTLGLLIPYLHLD